MRFVCTFIDVAVPCPDVFGQEQEWHVVETLKDDIAELKEAQFQVKVHEKEIQLITEVRPPIPRWGASTPQTHIPPYNRQLIARGWEVAYNNGTTVGGRRSIVFRRKLH
jgi:hypothetical protein